MNFQVGDRVRYVGSLLGLTNKEGTVLGNAYFISVRMDEVFPEGHTCRNRCEDGHGWNFTRDNLIILSQSLYEDVVI